MNGNANSVDYTLALTPEGKRLLISTIRCLPGGGVNNPNFIPGADLSDYENYNIWPFETMVFPDGSSCGLYHEPHETEAEAKLRHAAIVDMVERGLEFPGESVNENGTPTMGLEQWRQRLARAAS